MTQQEVVLLAACIAAGASLLGVGVTVWSVFSKLKREAQQKKAEHRIERSERLRTNCAELISLYYLVNEGNSEQVPNANRQTQYLHLLLTAHHQHGVAEMMRAAFTHALNQKGTEFLEAIAEFTVAVEDLLRGEWQQAMFEIEGKS